jgi:hypothetical protein
VLISQTFLFIHFWTLDLICKMVHGAPQCWAWALSHFLFSSFGLEHHCIDSFFVFAQKFWILWIFLHAPQLCMGTFNRWGFSCPQELFGHFHRWRLFMPPSIVWALSIIKDFWHLPPSVGCDPSQGYFKKNALGSKGDCKGYISALWKDYQRWPFFISNACI